VYLGMGSSDNQTAKNLLARFEILRWRVAAPPFSGPTCSGWPAIL
jgi:hypothetical protein